MTIFSKDQVKNPIITKHGENIYELLGEFTTLKTRIHSLAYVEIKPGKTSLLHYHPVAEESYYILKGTGKVHLDEQEFPLAVGDCVLIKPNVKHKIFNTGPEPLEFLAICVPAWEPRNTVWLETEA